MSERSCRKHPSRCASVFRAPCTDCNSQGTTRRIVELALALAWPSKSPVMRADFGSSFPESGTRVLPERTDHPVCAARADCTAARSGSDNLIAVL